MAAAKLAYNFLARSVSIQSALSIVIPSVAFDTFLWGGGRCDGQFRLLRRNDNQNLMHRRESDGGTKISSCVFEDHLG